MAEITIPLRDTEITEMEIERVETGQTIRFSIEGAVKIEDSDIIQDAFEAQTLEPISITVETGNE